MSTAKPNFCSELKQRETNFLYYHIFFISKEAPFTKQFPGSSVVTIDMASMKT
jgi:hypothetical protein